jgi:16S rRNA (cytosine967-C5)-methyltransferase
VSDGAAPRAAAARCIAAVLGGQTLERGLDAQLTQVAARDHGLLRELSYGTLRYEPLLEARLARLLDRPLRARDRELRGLLLVGLYQLAEMRTPPHAAVSASVAATGMLRLKSARGLVNAVLRRYTREATDIDAGLAPAARAGLPDWLWQALGADWPAQRDVIAAASLARPPLTLRVNALRADRETCLGELAAAGIAARPGTLAPGAITLAAGRDVDSIPGFRDGRVSVQDEAAQLAAQLLDPQPGERILDACAAPGGKTCHLLERVGGSATLLACDSSEERLLRVRDNLERLGLSAETLCADLRQPPATLAAASFDALLLDVPCSASGVLRRHPDVKLLRRPSDIAAFAATQGALLAGCWPLLKPGGRLLYVTCSVLDAENSAVIADFLAATEDAGEQALAVPGAAACRHGGQVLPQADGPDGLYFALLRKGGCPAPA